MEPGGLQHQSSDGAHLCCSLTSSVRGGKNSKEKNGFPSLMEAFILSIIFIVPALCCRLRVEFDFSPACSLVFQVLLARLCQALQGELLAS